MNSMEKRPIHDITLWVFMSYFLLSILLVGWLFWPFGSTIVMAAVVTGLFYALYERLTRKLSPALSSLVACIVIFIVVLLPIVFLIGILTQEAYDLYQMGRTAEISAQVQKVLESSRFVATTNQLLDVVGIQLTGEEIKNTFSEIGKTVGLFLYRQTQATAQNILSFFVNIFIMLLICYYLFIDGKRLIAFLVELSPLPREQEEQLIRKFQDMAGAILIGNGLGGVIQGILGGAVFALFGLQSPLLWGVVMGLLAFLPIVGIGVVFLPAAILLFVNGRIAAGIFFILFYIVITVCIEYIFKPRIVGHRVQMHILLVFLSIIGGLNLFGILGIVYGPLVMTAFLTLTDIYHRNYEMRINAAPTLKS
jgi:predicted PurR-regulated permease PerM